jgi:hypothetical protein
MACVVKARGPGPAGTCWLTQPDRDRVRALGSRDAADVFATTLEAYAAIADLPREVRAASAAFLVESIRDSSTTAGDRMRPLRGVDFSMSPIV